MTDEAKALVKRRYLLVKRGLYYAPDRQGYTGLKAKAGRYREVDALGLDGVTAIHEDEAQDFAPACWEETKLAHLDGIIETQAREIERLNTLLSEMNDTDVIARTMAENERLRAALHGIAEFGGRHTGHGYSCHLLARAALAGDSHDQ